MFQLSAGEYDALTSQIVISDKDDARGASALRSQIVISKKGRGGEGTAICTAALLFTGTPVAQEAGRRSQTAATGNDEARITNDEGMTKHECNVLALALALARARNRTSDV